MPRYARTARFNHDKKRVSCTPDTRTEVLDTIYRWFSRESLETGHSLPIEGNGQGRIFWLDGEAGSGKSTIAQTVANHFSRSGELGASFFCSRDDASCSDVGLVFLTIAYQLSLFNNSFRRRLSEAMSRDPYAQFTLPSMQLEKLIIDPLEAAMCEEAFPPCIVVIDALDECEDENATSTILSAISAFPGRLHPLKFFVTSRPTTNSMRRFRNMELTKDTAVLVLHDIPWDISHKDIHVFLADRLAGIARSFQLNSWPSSEEQAKLVELSGGLFIYAATVANFIEDRNASNPMRRLEIMLSTTYIISSSTAPYRYLDTLYLGVLRETFPDISNDQRASLQTVLGTIVLLSDPLSPESLEALLGLEVGTVRPTLLPLHFIVNVPDVGGGPIRLAHLLFHDFLIDIDRCTDTDFIVDAQPQHTLLAQQCLRALQTLSRDMCKIGNPLVYNQDVFDLPIRIANNIPAHVRYACQHWAYHLLNGNIQDTTLDLLLVFCSSQLLNWLEVMSLLGKLDNAVTALQSAHRTIKVGYFGISPKSVNKQCWLDIENRTGQGRDPYPSFQLRKNDERILPCHQCSMFATLLLRHPIATS
jgi:hypothetical protein